MEQLFSQLENKEEKDLCQYCNKIIKSNQGISVLQCNCIYHTQCILRKIFLRQAVCQCKRIIDIEITDEDEQMILDRVHSIIGLRKEIQGYIKKGFLEICEFETTLQDDEFRALVFIQQPDVDFNRGIRKILLHAMEIEEQNVFWHLGQKLRKFLSAEQKMQDIYKKSKTIIRNQEERINMNIGKKIINKQYNDSKQKSRVDSIIDNRRSKPKPITNTKRGNILQQSDIKQNLNTSIESPIKKNQQSILEKSRDNIKRELQQLKQSQQSMEFEYEDAQY